MKNNKEALTWGGVFLFLYLLVYGLLLCRFSLHWDEILDYQGQACDTYIAAGRWGLYAYRFLMGEGAYPILAGLVSGIYISLALVVQIHLLELRSACVKLLYAALYISCIQWASQLIYSMQCDAVAFGLLCATLSVFALNKSKWLLAGIALTVSLGTYQTCGLYFLCLLLSVSLFQKNGSIRHWTIYGGVILLSLVSYALINLGMKYSPLLSVASTEYMRMVQADLNQWATFVALPLFDKVIFACHYCKVVLLNALGVGNHTHWLYGSAVIPLALLCWRLWKQERGLLLWLKLTALLTIWIAPFALTLVMGREMELRTALAAPLSLAALWALAFKEGNWNRKTQYSAIVVCCVLLLKSAYTVSACARDEAHDYSVALQEIARMHAAAFAVADCDAVSSIIVVGKLDRSCRSPHTLFFRNGTFDWYARHYHWSQMKYMAEVPVRHQNLYQAMPVWPALGSVRLNAGEVIIRIAD